MPFHDIFPPGRNHLPVFVAVFVQERIRIVHVIFARPFQLRQCFELVAAADSTCPISRAVLPSSARAHQLACMQRGQDGARNRACADIGPRRTTRSTGEAEKDAQNLYHVNNTNPLLDEDSDEYRQVIAAGWEVRAMAWKSSYES